jgi:lipopolysaccharide/colanic/teichoic acid biosynthesis glycosyltransferase
MPDLKPIVAESVSFSLAKRVFDLVFSTLVLLPAFPHMLAIALADQLTPKGSVRTMRVGKMEERRNTGRSGEPRRTHFGALLRRASLDETSTPRL